MTPERHTAAPVTLPPLLTDRVVLLLLFLGLRVGLLLAYEPLLLAESGVERGITAGGDFLYYHALAAQWDDGLLPFRDWWSEFPPLWSVVEVGLYALLGGEVPYSRYAFALALVMLAADTATLLLIRAIGTRLHGRGTGAVLGWAYALLAAPLVFAYWTFEPLVACLLLAGVHALLTGRDRRAGLWLGLGALVKFVPVVALGAALRFRPARRAALAVGVALGVFALAYGPLLAGAGTRPYALASLSAQFSKASYQTVWALLDGNMTTGVFGPASARTDLAQASALNGLPAVVPGWARLAVALLAGLAIFVGTRRTDPRGQVAFVLVALLVFFLQAQGWSPQWLCLILPLLLLVYPARLGVQVSVILTLLTLAEYPFLLFRTGDGVVDGALVLPFALLVLARTTLLLGVCAALVRLLRQPAPAAMPTAGTPVRLSASADA